MRLYRPLKLCASVFALIWLYGCAAPIVPYVPPTGGDTAKLFIKGKLDATRLSRFDTFGHSKECTEPQSLATPVNGMIDTEIEMHADTPFTIRLFQRLPRALCSYIATFEPKKNHKYYLEPFDTYEACGFAIFDVSSGNRVLEPSTRKRISNARALRTFCSAEETPTMGKIAKSAKKPSLADLRDLLPEKDLKP
jgi:hypothetical protein